MAEFCLLGLGCPRNKQTKIRFESKQTKLNLYRLCAAHGTFRYLSFAQFALKGPKHEIFGSGFFTQIKLVWLGDLGTRTKNSKLGWFGAENRHFVLFSAVGYSAKEL
jgi:hypothetical protein